MPILNNDRAGNLLWTSRLFLEMVECLLLCEQKSCLCCLFELNLTEEEETGGSAKLNYTPVFSLSLAFPRCVPRDAGKVERFSLGGGGASCYNFDEPDWEIEGRVD